MLPSHERNAAPTARVWLSALLRFVNRTIKKNARTGGSGISQINVVVVILSLPLHQVDVVRHNCVATTIYRDHQREPYSNFCCCDRKDNDRKYLPCHLRDILTISPKGSQVDVDGVQHQLNTKQNRNGVPSRKDAEQTNAEEQRSKKEIPGKWNH